MCIPALISPFGNTTCKETVESVLAYYDMDNIETGAEVVVDMASTPGT